MNFLGFFDGKLITVYATVKLHLLSEIAASFAHEIRNPLTTAKGFMQLTTESLENERLNEYISIATSHCKSYQECN